MKNFIYLILFLLLSCSKLSLDQAAQKCLKNGGIPFLQYDVQGNISGIVCTLYDKNV